MTEYLRRVRRLAHNPNPFAGLGVWEQRGERELVIRCPALCDVETTTITIPPPPPSPKRHRRRRRTKR